MGTTSIHALLIPLKYDVDNPIEDWLPRLVRGLGSTTNRLKVYIGVDFDDPCWNTALHAKAKAVASEESFDLRVVVSPTNQPSGAVSTVWRALAQTAVDDDNVDGWLVLGGDDVDYKSTETDWLEAAWGSHGCTTFTSEKSDYGMRHELELLMPTDASDPSCCTFPIVSAAHVHLLGGLFPPDFVNHGADPFLWSMYRRICSVVELTHVSVHNRTGGPATTVSTAPPPRYESKRIDTALFDALLDKWTEKLAGVTDAWNFSLQCISLYREARSDFFTPSFVLSVDVIVPCYRCDVAPLIAVIKSCRHAVANSHASGFFSCDVRTIVVVDDPNSPKLESVLALSATDVRVRVNSANSGASASRNRGLQESMADLIVFIDDDVFLQNESILKLIGGLVPWSMDRVGAAARIEFPPSKDIWHEATRMSRITLAFDWPEFAGKGHVAPWCVTAAMAVWRKYASDFDERYAKTGGGEDVDFCLRAVQNVDIVANRSFVKVNDVGIVHPFWERRAGVRGSVDYLGHFWRWTMGDGHLLTRFPEHTYMCIPNVIEISLPVLYLYGLRGLFVIWLVELVEESCAALKRGHSKHLLLEERAAAAILSAVVKNVVDAGHTWFWIKRGRLDMMCRRFDWFCGLTDDVVHGERSKFAWRGLVWIACLSLLCPTER